MTLVQKTVLWTLTVCVFGYIAIHVLIVKAPGMAQAQQRPADPSGATPLPEEDSGVGEERAAPAQEPARVLKAVCLDKGMPLDGVIVDILRQTPGESVFDPRVESFGRTKTKDDGQFSVRLPRIQGKTEANETAALYILYFTAPGRPIKSLIVDNDTELPKEIVIPKESTEDVYLPRYHLVVAKAEGISVSLMLSAPRGISKDGQPLRVEKLIDQRIEGKQRTADSASMSANRTDANSTAVVAYAVRHSTPVEVAKVIESQFAGRFRQVGRDDRNSLIFVEADAETQREIRGVIKHLEEHARPFPTSGTVQREQATAPEQIRAARQKLTAAKTDEERQFARAQLRKLLSAIFATDMLLREKQAAEIESRLANLRQQYQSRQKVKDEIIDLQLKVIEQDAAGLGFPGGGSVSPTPASGVGASGFDRGGRLRAPPAPEEPAPEEPMEGSFRASTRRVDKDPIPREGTVEDVKKKHPVEVAELKKHGHFIESSDGSVYAYANIHQRSSSSQIRVVDSATGKLIGTATIGSIVGPLQFTEEGVASREGSELELRIPLRRRKGPEGDVYERVPAAEVSVSDRIKSLGLKLGHEMKTSLDKRYPMRITGKEGETTIKAGETKLIELPQPTLAVQWQCGDFKPEAVDDVEPFDYVLVEWKADGHVTWSCYRSPAASMPEDHNAKSGAQTSRGLRVPALGNAESVSVRDMLAIRSEGTSIDYDQPAEEEIDACRVVLESGEAWTLLDRNLVLLRRFVDKNHDGIVDLWAYYKSGKEVWRDEDTDFDGRADHHEGVDSGSDVPSVRFRRVIKSGGK